MPVRQPAIARTEMRSRIEEAAARLSTAKGYEATTVDEIVDEAEVSKPALYRFFASKKDLYMELLERNRDELAAAALAAVTPEGDPFEWVPAMVDAWFVFVESYPFT